MPTPYKFLDNPVSKTVTAVFADNTQVIIQAMSYSNYTNPPGYLQPNADENTVKQGLRDRVADYRTYLNTQLNG